MTVEVMPIGTACNLKCRYCYQDEGKACGNARAGCRFFLMCKGHCPATAMEGNIAGRSEHCSLWYRLYEHFEEESILNGHEPLSRSPVRPALENLFLRCWEKGLYPSMERLLPQARKETVIARFRDDG